MLGCAQVIVPVPFRERFTDSFAVQVFNCNGRMRTPTCAQSTANVRCYCVVL